MKTLLTDIRHLPRWLTLSVSALTMAITGTLGAVVNIADLMEVLSL